MPVWFVYRSPYHGPLSKHVQRLDGPDSLLGWFRSVWRAIPDVDAAIRYAETLLGTYVYAFNCLFRDAAEHEYPPPETDDELHERLRHALYVQGFHADADSIEVLSDDDELCMAMYWFTDAFAAAHPERVAWLLHDEPRLPAVVGPGGFEHAVAVSDASISGPGEGALYVWEWYWECSSDLEDGGGFDRVRGVRLPELVPWLLGMPVEDADTSNDPIVYCLRGQLDLVLNAGEGLEASFRRSLRDDPADGATWAAYADWLADHDLPRAELHLLELAVRVRLGDKVSIDSGEHHVFVTYREDDESDRYNQWIFFDDRWASGNETLARSLIGYASRWDVLHDRAG